MTSKKSDRKQEILLATFKALKVHGLSNLSYDLIANHGPVSRQLIRYHFSEPDDLMIALCDYLAGVYREALIAEVMKSGGQNRLRTFFDFYFDLLEEAPKPRDDQIYDALMSMATGSKRIQETLRNQYSLLGQVIAHEIELEFPSLDNTAAKSLSYLFVCLMYGHWKMVASLGFSEEHRHVTRSAMDRLIASYVTSPTERSVTNQIWLQDR